MAADQAPDPHRTTYEPAGKSQVRQQFRPTSAPRAARSLAEPARGGAAEGQDGGAAHDRRDRPTSAPLAREGVGGGEFAGGGGVPAHGQAAGSDGDGDSQAHEVGMAAGGYYPYVMRPTSAPSRPPYVLEAGPEQRPGSAGAGRPRLAARSRAGTRLPNSGALRFVEEASGRPPVRVFSPMTSPLTDTTRFQPTWALSKHRQREREMLAESSLQAALSYEGSRLGSAGGTRPGSVISQASTGSAAASRRAAGSAAGPYKDMPRMAIRNPLAQRIGGSTGDLAEVNGSFIPLQSQSKIPHYDALYDPHLKAFWGRQDVKKVLSLEGKTRDHWAPDSGMLEAAISQELTELSRPRDIAEVMAPLDPLISALGVDPPDVLPGVNLASDVMQIEVSEEAVSVAAEFLPLSLKQPVISTWLHWGSQTGATTAPDLDLSAVCFDSKARVLDTIFYRNLVSRHEAIVHLGDDTDDTIAPAELVTNPNTAADDVAAATRRKEGLLIHLPRIQKDVVAIALAVTCYSEEMGLSEAAGAEMRVCVGPTHAAGLDNDLVRYVLSSERYKAAAPCMLVRDNASESGWSIFTRPRVCLANVVVEMIPVLQTMLRQTNVCVPYVLHVEYCTARRPTSSLRGKRSDYINSFKAVALAVRRAFPFVVVQGNPMAPEEQPRVGSFEISFVDAERGTSQLLFSKIQQGKWPARMDTILRSVAEAMASVQVMYQLPDDRSEVEASVVDAVSGLEVPWAVVEVHALGLAAQKLQIVERSATTKSGKRSKSSSSKSASRNADTLAPGKRLYRVQTNGNGVLRMRLPGGRYEIWGISQGYDCEYPLEMHVRPYSKFKLHARLALRKVDGAEGGAEAGAQDAETVEAVETVGSSTLPPPE